MPLLRIVLVVSLAGGCAADSPPPVTPAAPLPADPLVAVGSMDTECDAMVAALEAYKTCPNLEDEDRDELDSWIEVTNRNFAAGRKAKPDPKAQHTIAVACRRATTSIHAAHQRCLAGPKPKRDD